MKLYAFSFLSVILVACGQTETSRQGGTSTNAKSFSMLTLQENDHYPIKPDKEMTPGTLCEHPSEIRYPEHIKYCRRNVDPSTKAGVFAHYDEKLGFHTTEMGRSLFKVDHLIPLCMGGGNDEGNLWPQHQTVYNLTDPLEPFLCELMSAGKLKQVEAVQIVQEVKQAPDTTDARIHQLRQNYHM